MSHSELLTIEKVLSTIGVAAERDDNEPLTRADAVEMIEQLNAWVVADKAECDRMWDRLVVMSREKIARDDDSAEPVDADGNPLPYRVPS